MVRSIDCLSSLDTIETDSASCIRSIPDREVVVKSMHVPADQPLPSEERARFELAASLLDSEDFYTFDLIPTSRPNRILGLAYRRQSPTGNTGRMRAAALGMGYLTFARTEPGDLVCLADIGAEAVSVCFVYQKKIISLTSLAFDRSTPVDEQACKKIAVELRTITNFKLAELADLGITVPLAKLVVSGECEESWLPVFTRLFPTGVTRPRLNEAYFAESARGGEVPLERFMVALGLTVK